MRRLLPCLALLAACDPFTEVSDGGVDVQATDGAAQDHPGGEALADAAPAADLGGKRLAGECCAKEGDCVSGLCTQQGSGPFYCNKVCNTSPDDCPVGFGCDGQTRRCMPPPIGDYACGAHVVQAGPQPLGGCCGKQTDCTSGHCINVGAGEYFCSQSCTSQPTDTCPVGYACSTADLCATQGASSCTYF